MADHAFALSRTNSGAVVATCSCGWVGIVRPVDAMSELCTAPGEWPAQIETAARDEWAAHDPALRAQVRTRAYRCDVCRRELVLELDALACPRDGGTLSLARRRP